MIGPASCWGSRGVRSNEQEVELRVTPGLLGVLPLRGRLVTGDALYCQRHLCAQIVAAGGDYLLIVKANQPRLYQDIVLLFAEPPPGEVFAMAKQWGRHGDRQEVRRLWASTALRGYLDWPGAEQVCMIQRVSERKGKVTGQVRYAITSLTQLPQFHAQGVFDLSVKWRKDYTTFREFSFVEAGAIVVSATGSPVASSAGRCSVFG